MQASPDNSSDVTRTVVRTRNYETIRGKTGAQLIFIQRLTFFANYWSQIDEGQTHVFQLFTPQTRKVTQMQETVSNIVSEITQEGSSDRLNATEFARHLQDRHGKRNAEKVFKELQELQPLIEEANMLTDELRGEEEEEWNFNPRVLSNVILGVAHSFGFSRFFRCPCCGAHTWEVETAREVLWLTGGVRFGVVYCVFSLLACTVGCVAQLASTTSANSVLRQRS